MHTDQIMKLLTLKDINKRWALGPWNSKSPVEIGHTELCSTELHFHKEVHEYFVCLRGWCIIEVEGRLYKFMEGQLMYFEPGEAHRLTGEGSQDFYMLMIKYPSLPEDKTIV
jgi:mannose-6-phosphate isomerase-like protein (cupin superfamily)